jgi:anthranilate synthase component 1
MPAVPSYETFAKLARGANTIPVYREIAADLDTPVSAFLKLHRSGQGFLLESVEGGDRWGRYSVLGTDPLMVLRASGGVLVARRRDGSEERIEGDPLAALARVLEPFRQACVDGLSRFGGGFVGYLAYDVVRHIEDLPTDTVDDLGVADVAGVVADKFILFDNVTHTMKVVCLARIEDASDLEKAYAEAVATIDQTVDLLRSRSASLPEPSESPYEAPRSNMMSEEYGAGVERAREYIRAGDIIQVVLSQRFSGPLASHPFSIYRALRTINPSPYMFYLDLEEEIVVGASPEVMVKVEGARASVRPIAGTIRRGRDEAEDRALVEKMLADPKEQAEHIMLLDLGRNDIGRVAVVGSVRVDEQMTVERYSHVNHIVSHVSGTLREDADRFDAFRATFPAGTLSGAPKVRAMEIIEELEPTRRGVYGGAVGYIDFDANLDTCIAIRTVLVKNDTVYLQVGAGIVADSDPVREQAECEEKARGILLALERAAELEKGQ